jgi:hypothetical protein
MNGLPNGLAATSLLLCCSLALVATSCNPYRRFAKDDDSLGPVDPVNFPAGNLGTMGNRMQPGVGSFSETTAFVGGAAVGYFAYALPAPSPASADLLRLIEDGKPYASALATPTAYVFDGACTAPSGYQYQLRTDEVRLDQQGNIFTALPSASYTPGVASSTRYVPVVAEAAASAAGLPCQNLKSEQALASQLGGVASLPAASGKYRAWMIIDPAAGVYPRDDPRGAMMMPMGVGLQSWGWYNRFLLAYLDGGTQPTVESDVNDGTVAMPVMHHVVRMQTQRLYYPRSQVIGTSMGVMTMAAGARGAGYDVLQARRGDVGYSPLCEVMTYDAGMPMAPGALPRNAADIEAAFGAVLMPGAPRYVFCLQVR